MLNTTADVTAFSRREALTLAAALALATVAPRAATAQNAGDGQPFSFDLLTEEMRLRATQDFVPAERPEGFLGNLDYDDYRNIRFLPERARWIDSDQPFRVHAFHTGWLFGEPVTLSEVRDGMARAMSFTTTDFDYMNDLAGTVAPDQPLPGVAGFRFNYPLNRPDRADELVAFLGASYFRALGQGNGYGISARGIAINTGSGEPEEFPRFTRFYLEHPGPDAAEAVVYAALEGPSVTGAYRFAIRPGITTEMDVTARLFFRADVAELGVAPLTSMFLYDEKNRSVFDDYRPKVHDSNGLRLVRRDGDVLWRPLNNPATLANAYFTDGQPLRFGLHQRDRDFANYQDSESHYEARPSLDVEPLGDWGPGMVRLVEIPTDLEVNDNIVAFWVPEAAPRAGDAREFAYRLHWGNLDPADTAEDLARVAYTRTGAGGVSGVPSPEGKRKFVVDFQGAFLSALTDADVDAITPVVTLSSGEIASTSLEKIETADIWRLVLDIRLPEGETIEMSAHLAGFDRKLTETWLYQWVNG